MIKQSLMLASIAAFLSSPVLASEAGSVGFAYQVPATEAVPPPPPEVCTFGSTENIAALSEPTYDTSDSTWYFTEIEFESWPLQITIPSSITRVLLGVSYVKFGDVSHEFGLPDVVLTADDGSIFPAGRLSPVNWEDYLLPSDDFVFSDSGVILKSGWVTDTPTTITIPELEIYAPPSGEGLLRKPDPTKNWSSSPVFLTCYDG